VQAYGNMLLTADGHKIITAVTRDTWQVNHVVLGKHSALQRIGARQRAESGTTVTFTEFAAATAKPVAALAGVQGEGGGITWAEVTWASPDGRALIIDGAWPKAGGHWPISHDGPPVAVAGVMTGGTFTPFPKKVQALYFDGQATW